MFAASHLVLKDNFTVVAQPSLTGNCFSWDHHSKGTTESLQVVVLANSIHFSRHAMSSCKYNSSGLAASCDHFWQTSLCFSDRLLNTTTVSVLKPLAKTTGNDTVTTTPRKSENPNNCTVNTILYFARFANQKDGIQ